MKRVAAGDEGLRLALLLVGVGIRILYFEAARSVSVGSHRAMDERTLAGIQTKVTVIVSRSNRYY